MRHLTLLVLLGTGCTPDADTADSTAPEGLHGRVEAVDGLPVLKLWGTREEMGYAEGALFCEQMPDLLRDYVLEYLVADYGVPYSMVLALVENAITLPPDHERELQALWAGAEEHCTEDQLWIESEYLEPDAEGARAVTYTDLVAANILADWGCSSFTAWGEATETGQAIHARNFDWAIDPGGRFLEQHLLKVYSSDEEGGARFASLTTPGLIGCITCFTEEGVGLTMHNIWEAEPATQATGIYPRMLAARSAITATWEADDLVARAEAALEAAPQRAGNNLHLSFPTERDGGSGAVVFEFDGNYDHADGQVTVRRPGFDTAIASDEAIACTNHYLERRDPPEDNDSTQRLSVLQAGLRDALAGDGLDVEGARALIEAVSWEATAHSVVMDQASGELRVFVATEAGTPAPTTEPAVVHLDSLFEDLP
jgi:hypothetical protein